MKEYAAVILFSAVVIGALVAMVIFALNSAIHIKPGDPAIDACTTLCGANGVASFTRGAWNDTSCLCNPRIKAP